MGAQQWTAAPLTWGHGSKVLEAFLEPTCPFSARAFPKLFALLDAVGEDRLTVRLRLHSQPWHLFSGIVTRAILAASTGGKESARRVMETVFEHREDYEFTHHAGGPNMDVTPNAILERIEAQSGIAVRAAFALPDLDREIKWHTRYARQNGVHVSPTFMVDGLIEPRLSSGDAHEKWAEVLGLEIGA